MIGSFNRFHGHGSIRKLYGAGKSVRTGVLSLRYAENPKRSSYRMAVVVSRKVSKSAVVRNRIRRRIYECVRKMSGNFARPYDLVFTVYDESVRTMASDKLEAEITTMMSRAKILSSDVARPERESDIVYPKEK
jgi:ribonuclease P protein component